MSTDSNLPPRAIDLTDAQQVHNALGLASLSIGRLDDWMYRISGATKREMMLYDTIETLYRTLVSMERFNRERLLECQTAIEQLQRDNALLLRVAMQEGAR